MGGFGLQAASTTSCYRVRYLNQAEFLAGAGSTRHRGYHCCRPVILACYHFQKEVLYRPVGGGKGVDKPQL